MLRRNNGMVKLHPGEEERTMAVQALKKPAGPKDLYELGEIPPLGHVPEKMYAWAIRKERHGPPESAMQVEVGADLDRSATTRSWSS